MNAPDFAQTGRFLTAIEPGEQTFTFQTFADKKEDRDNRNLLRVLHGTFTQHSAQLAALNQQGAGVFMCINETNGNGRKAENVTRVRALFVDLDGAPLRPVLEHTSPPDIIVESSPGKWHAYWRVQDCPLDQFKPAQQKLAALFHGDPSVCDLPRVMRLPGFFHQKDLPVLTRLVEPLGGVQ